MKTALCVIFSQMLSIVACQQSNSLDQPSRHLEVHQASPSPSQGSRQWRAATFQRLTMGKSTRADMLRVLGKPLKTKPFKEGKKSGTLYVYNAEGEIPGELVVTVDDPAGVIFNVELDPRNLSEKQAIQHFGEGYEITRYDFDLCLGDGESAPLYESPTGSLTFIEYRLRGIAILENEEGRIDEIKYVSEPVGAPSSRCKEKNQSP